MAGAPCPPCAVPVCSPTNHGTHMRSHDATAPRPCLRHEKAPPTAHLAAAVASQEEFWRLCGDRLAALPSSGVDDGGAGALPTFSEPLPRDVRALRRRLGLAAAAVRADGGGAEWRDEVGGLARHTLLRDLVVIALGTPEESYVLEAHRAVPHRRAALRSDGRIAV